MFYIPWAGNGEELQRLYALVDQYRAPIASGEMPLYVDGYCASQPTARERACGCTRDATGRRTTGDPRRRA